MLLFPEAQCGPPWTFWEQHRVEVVAEVDNAELLGHKATNRVLGATGFKVFRT